MTFNPPRVSSNVDKNNPVSTCTLLERFFKLFPIREIMNPEIGMNGMIRFDHVVLVSGHKTMLGTK